METGGVNNDSKAFYYEALQESSIGWHTNEDDIKYGFLNN